MKAESLIFWLRFLTTSLYQLYLFQLKEYRWDRLKEHLQRVWQTPGRIWWQTGLGAPFSRKKLPRLTPKAVVFFGLQLLFVLLTGWRWLSLLLPLPFVFAAITVAGGDWLIKRCLVFQAGKIVARWRQQGTRVIGVTGSFGKTTMVSFLSAWLKDSFTPPWGTNVEKALAWWVIKNRRRKPAKFLIVELGAYKRGEIATLVSWLKPEIAVTTGIGRQHLALFGSEENLILAKQEILAFAQVGFFNADSPGVVQLSADFQGEKIFYGRSPRSDYQLTKVSSRVFYRRGWRAEQRWEVKRGKKKWRGKVDFLGEHFLINLCGALAVVDYLQAAKKPLPPLKLPRGRLSVRTGLKGALVLDASYNQSEASIMAGLALLEKLKFPRKILALAELIELGEQKREVERRIKEKIKGKITLVKDKEKLAKLLQESAQDTVIFISGRILPAAELKELSQDE